MMTRFINPVGLGLMVLLVIGHVILDIVDRQAYSEKDFYQNALGNLTNLELKMMSSSDSLKIGFAKVDITPTQITPLAGYGGRRPKEFESIHDSVYIRTIVFSKGNQKAAIVSADLLIVHPELTNHTYLNLPNWKPEELYFSATHSHSSFGGWASSPAGRQFGGSYDESIVKRLAKDISVSVEQANANAENGLISYNALQVPELIRNRLVKDRGIVDPWLKVIGLQSGSRQGIMSVYGAHATCLGRHNRELSGDYPGHYNTLLESDTAIDFSLFAAGAVGSMKPTSFELKTPWVSIEMMASQLKENIDLLMLLEPDYISPKTMGSFKLDLPMRKPGLKISKDLQLRPWLFETLFGQSEMYIKGLIFDNTLLIGLPFDFSGELAVPLYQSASQLGLNLVITSFNGGYGGYLIKDEWYDLSKYEARTMSWYGPDAGSYVSEIVSLILSKVASEVHIE